MQIYLQIMDTGFPLMKKKTVRCQKVNTQLLALGKFMTNSETDRIA